MFLHQNVSTLFVDNIYIGKYQDSLTYKNLILSPKCPNTPRRQYVLISPCPETSQRDKNVLMLPYCILLQPLSANVIFSHYFGVPLFSPPLVTSFLNSLKSLS